MSGPHGINSQNVTDHTVVLRPGGTSGWSNLACIRAQSRVQRVKRVETSSTVQLQIGGCGVGIGGRLSTPVDDSTAYTHNHHGEARSAPLSAPLLFDP